MTNDQALLDSFNHWQRVGYSVQSSMILALEVHLTNPGRPENSNATVSLSAGLRQYRRTYTNLAWHDLP